MAIELGLRTILQGRSQMLTRDLFSVTNLVFKMLSTVFVSINFLALLFCDVVLLKSLNHIQYLCTVLYVTFAIFSHRGYSFIIMPPHLGWGH